MYIRFVCANKVDGLNAREGFFCAAYELRSKDDLDRYTSELLEELLSWFRQNLIIPKKFNRSKSKGYWRRKTKGISWFKSEAIEVISKSRELIALLESHGYHIDTLHSERVGYVVYEDDNQIVAEPFSDTAL